MVTNQRYHIFSTIFIFLSVIACEIKSSELLRPRGVSIARAPLYAPGQEFTCLDGSLKIPFTHINDDYCDCPDGSDEPGTSACPNGVFHCTNAGHQPLNIPSSRVNDGICDCCDASDEYARQHSRCVNSCFELGNSARIEAQRKLELIKAGSVRRNELIQQGQQTKQQKLERLEVLQKNKTEAEQVKEELERVKKESEHLENQSLEQYRLVEEEEKRRKHEKEAELNAEEATEQFQRFDSNADGVLEVAELQTSVIFDSDKNGEVSEEEAKYFLEDRTEITLDDFITIAWPRIKPYIMMENGVFQPPPVVSNDDPEPESNKPEEEKDFEEFHDEEEDGDVEGAENGADAAEEVEPEPERHYDEATQRLIDHANEARNEFNQAERSVREIQSEITTIEEYLEQDYGPEDEFLLLHSSCFEYSDREYVYKLCPFENASQQPRNGGSETRLGVWNNWSGPSNNKYEQMLYDKGASCWNGPQRSTRVHIYCGIEEKITSVSEPNRCEYEFRFQTPAVCYENAASQTQSDHDEL